MAFHQVLFLRQTKEGWSLTLGPCGKRTQEFCYWTQENAQLIEHDHFQLHTWTHSFICSLVKVTEKTAQGPNLHAEAGFVNRETWKRLSQSRSSPGGISQNRRGTMLFLSADDLDQKGIFTRRRCFSARCTRFC